MIETIVSDLGNVLLRFDNMTFFRALASFTSHPVADIRRATHDNLDLAVLFEKGAISPLDFYANARDLLEISASYEEFYALYCDIFVPNPPVFDLFRRLRPRFKMVLLSNTDVMRWTFIKRRFSEILFFDAYVLSFDTGVRKPDPLVYREALRLVQGRPETSVFIDDLEENADAARRLGWMGIVYGAQTDLESELNALSLRA